MASKPEASGGKQIRGNIGGAVTDKKEDKRKSSVHLLDNKVGCSDMVLLDPLSEDSLIKNLKARFNAGEIYVRTLSIIASSLDNYNFIYTRV